MGLETVGALVLFFGFIYLKGKMVIKNIFRYSLAAAMLLLLFTLPAVTGLAGSPQAQERLRYEVEVTVTQIDVVVTGKSGKRVNGLKPENFKIFEDGRLQKMTNFFEVKGMEIYASTGGGKDGALKVPDKPLPPRVAAPSITNKIIFYFDNLQLHPLNRNWSIKKLEKFVKNNFPPGGQNQGMVVSLDDKLEVVCKFTNRASLLLEAMKFVKKRSGAALLRVRRREALKKELGRLVEDTGISDQMGRYESALDQARNFAEVEQNDLGISLKALGALIDYMTGMDGRKMLIYISDGLSISPGEEVFNFLNQAFPRGNAGNEAMNYDATRKFKDLTSKCNANEISLYPVNSRGLETSILGADKAAGWHNRSRGSGMVRATSRIKNDAYNMMARDTGGMAINSTNNIESGLKRIKDDLNYYYSLGYRSLYRGDNKYHSIKVKLVGTEKKYKVRVRQGHKHISPEAKIKESVISRLFIKRYTNPLGVRAKFLPVRPKAFSNKFRLGFKIWIPLKNLVLKRRRVESVGRFKVYVILKDADGGISPCHELIKEVKIPLKDYDEAIKSSFPYEVEMFVNPGQYTISVAVKDMDGAAPTYFQLQKLVAPS
jgi:VWFA-related protein